MKPIPAPAIGATFFTVSFTFLKTLPTNPPIPYRGIFSKNCSSIMHNPYKATVFVEKQGGQS
jgi:hypothetical protein